MTALRKMKAIFLSIREGLRNTEDENGNKPEDGLEASIPVLTTISHIQTNEKTNMHTNNMGAWDSHTPLYPVLGSNWTQ